MQRKLFILKWRYTEKYVYFVTRGAFYVCHVVLRVIDIMNLIKYSVLHYIGESINKLLVVNGSFVSMTYLN